MREIALEPILEVLLVVAELVAMIALSGLGFVAERAGLAHLASGVDPLTAWLFVVGTVALYAGLYLIGYRRLIPRFLGGIQTRNG